MEFTKRLKAVLQIIEVQLIGRGTSCVAMVGPVRRDW